MLLKHILHKSTCINWLLIGVLTIGTITSCSTPTKPSQQVGISSIDNENSLDALLSAASNAKQLGSPNREQQLTRIAKQLLRIGEQQHAKKTIESINIDRLSNDDYLAYALTAGDVFLQTQSLYQARQLLSADKLTVLSDQLSIDQQIQLHQVKAELYHQTGEIITSLNERIALGTLLSASEDINQNNDTIWQQLSSLTYNELLDLSASISDTILNGWFELAAVSKESQNSLQAQNSAIRTWVIANPNHPASQQLPADLALLQDLIQTRPNHIALLLPLQGKLAKAGQAIRDGFLAAYYRNHSNPESSPTIAMYDTSIGDINTIYDKAQADGANIIIGPLSKKGVKALQQRASLAVPTLALNYLDNDSTTTNNTNKPLYQFGLSLEDEAIQVADRAWLEGHRQALIISSKASWSQRATLAFIERWQTYGGTIVANNQLNNSESYSESIKNMLHINRSRQRATELKRLFGQGLEFEPRRRSDIDMVFLVARSKEGRQIKPTLNFHYAGNIPVYATSQIYSSANSANKNSDLNKIRLTTLPWVLNQNIAEKALINNNISVSPGYERLYALGVDSFLLYPRLQQLHQLSGQQLYGTTGQLSIDRQKRVQRKQLWAEIVRGTLHPLRMLTLSSDNTL